MSDYTRRYQDHRGHILFNEKIEQNEGMESSSHRCADESTQLQNTKNSQTASLSNHFFHAEYVATVRTRMLSIFR